MPPLQCRPTPACIGRAAGGPQEAEDLLIRIVYNVSPSTKGGIAMAKRSGSSKRRPPSRVRAERSASRRGGSRRSSGRLPSLRGQLERAAVGLLHTSESDFPFRFFSLPAE